jgi:hypothetical protein
VQTERHTLPEHRLPASQSASAVHSTQRPADVSQTPIRLQSSEFLHGVKATQRFDVQS